MCYTNTESLVRPEVNDCIDALEGALLDRYQKADFPLAHTFMPGMYMREIFMAAGSKITSRIHKFRHPFFVLRGKVRVWQDGKGWELIEAPHCGITEPGTRRVLDVIEDCNWITIHSNPDDTEDLEEIEARIIEHHTNNLLTNET
jgi:quercetin dioxygenase-like cupin family protein